MCSEFLKEALSQNTSAERLRILAEQKDDDILQAVANNPNSPIDVIKELFNFFPTYVLSNPAIDLLCLENSNLIDELFENCPIHWVASAEEFLNLNQWGELDLSNGEPLNLHQWGASIKNERIRCALAKSSQIDYDILEKLKEDKSASVRYYVAKNDKADIGISDYLANDTHKEVRLAVASNYKAGINALKKLVQDEDEDICLSAAKSLVKAIEESRWFRGQF